jgi:hypothetical protein
VSLLPEEEITSPARKEDRFSVIENWIETRTRSQPNLEWYSVEFTIFLNIFIFLASVHQPSSEVTTKKQCVCILWMRSNYSYFFVGHSFLIQDVYNGFSYINFQCIPLKHYNLDENKQFLVCVRRCNTESNSSPNIELELMDIVYNCIENVVTLVKILVLM